MAFQRRRNSYYNRLRRLLPLICAFSGALLILFALLSVFSPPPDVSDRRISKQINYGGNDQKKSIPVVFRVPTSGGRSDRDIWRSWNADLFYGCCNASTKFPNAKSITRSDRYLAIATSGGLNQQRTGIVDAVVAARILNATLVIPKLDQKSYWKDASDFSHIFQVDWFISFLSKDVKIIEQLPPKGGQTWTPSRMRVPRKCNEKCYINRVLPVLQKRHAVQLNKFDYRLSNKLRDDLQKLRCRVNYHALKFTDPILKMGNELVRRMRLRSKHYIALHLRFEPDMLAFSGCYYGGGDKEKKELGSIRRRWKTLHVNNPEKQRRQGRCPLTPEEVGLMLRALGYGSDVHIYVASGEVYGGEESLAPLKALFPHFYSKDTIATKEELEPFASYSSRMAALDFLVCDESDVFVTNNNGNMARILAGRRRYFGHKPTIRPNAKKLYKLFLSKENTTWEEFGSRVRTFQKGFMGEPKEVRAGRGEFHENPSTCICEDTITDGKSKEGGGMDSRKLGKKNKVSNGEQKEDEDAEWSSDYEEDQTDLHDRGLFNGTRLDYEDISSDDPELEEMLSD
ncbi:O-fucosyltransferase family protein [Raphanus sativus]|uniref:O-fucosyltransferase family protein n=1 Tax=Raphanus sativus TaxID=3726 RepID=A0A6J0JZ35_RAPSA|nr:O-fucosyltransferase 6 [Raphanus sativus]KAJ4916263.1 O-fucosyltransferase family protein [Raphanus sativus]